MKLYRRKPGNYVRKGRSLSPTGMKLCGHCNEEKPRERFHRSRNSWDGLYGYCKECCKDKMLNEYLKRTYGVTLMWYEEKMAEQNGGCAICGKEETIEHPGSKVLRLAVDHDHDTELVRGLLCNRCNCALAGYENLIRDGTLEKAKAYLARQNEEVSFDIFADED